MKKEKTLKEKRKNFVKIPETKLAERLKDGYYYGKDVKQFIKEILEEIDELKTFPRKIKPTYRGEFPKYITVINKKDVKQIIKQKAGFE